MNRLIALFILLFMVTTENGSAVHAQGVLPLNWSNLPPIPNEIGFAGSFAGVAGQALIVAGGANFPDGGTPWTGSKKAWSDQIFVLENADGQWKEVGKLPRKLGYGVSVNYKNSLIILGGSNETGHFADVLVVDYKNGKIEITNLPKLPYPIANTCGVIVGDVIYVMGGISTPDSKTTESNFWALNLALGHKEWKILPSWPGAGRMLSVAGTENGSVYLFSGVELINGERKYLTDAYRYKSSKGWEKIANLPSPVAAAPTPAFTFEDKKLLVFGGDDGIDAPNAAILREKHPGFSNQILGYHVSLDCWKNEGSVFTLKRDDAMIHPNESIWAPVTTTLTVWKGAIIIPGGEVRPATRTPNVLMAKPIQFKK